MAAMRIMWLALAGGLACAPPPTTWRHRPAVFHATRSVMEESWIERRLRARGLRFETDGTTRGLHDALAAQHPIVAPEAAAAGDVLFFVLDGSPCGDHAGLVEAVEPDGRVVFREWRGGQLRRSFLHPWEPLARRDGRGRLLNTFLRPKRPDDPPSAHYFAADGLCAVVRTR
jgi:hypothetical protein